VQREIITVRFDEPPHIESKLPLEVRCLVERGRPIHWIYVSDYHPVHQRRPCAHGASGASRAGRPGACLSHRARVYAQRTASMAFVPYSEFESVKRMAVDVKPEPVSPQPPADSRSAFLTDARPAVVKSELAAFDGVKLEPFRALPSAALSKAAPAPAQLVAEVHAAVPSRGAQPSASPTAAGAPGAPGALAPSPSPAPSPPPTTPAPTTAAAAMARAASTEKKVRADAVDSRFAQRNASVPHAVRRTQTIRGLSQLLRCAAPTLARTR
jgi:hypothetical protein